MFLQIWQYDSENEIKINLEEYWSISRHNSNQRLAKNDHVGFE